MDKELLERFLAKTDFKTPLLFPVTYNQTERVIRVLDETLLPWEEKYIDVRSLSDAEEVLYSMKTRAFGQVLLFLYIVALQAKGKTFEQGVPVVDETAQRFKKRRPTFDFLFIAQLLKKTASAQPRLSWDEAVTGFVRYFDTGRRRRALALAEVLPDKSTVLTVCNLNGELVYLYYAMRFLNKDVGFWVCETRPYLQGTRLTFWELQKEGVPSCLLCDNQAAYAMHAKKVQAVVVGADRANTRGDIINKIGTYALARLCSMHAIPFYAYTQYPKDVDIEQIRIEQRPFEEVYMYCDTKLGTPDAVYPNFDITPAEYISGWVTPEGMKLKMSKPK